MGILAVFKIHKMNEGKFLKQRKQIKNIHSDLRNVKHSYEMLSIRKKSQHWEIKRKPEKNPVESYKYNLIFVSLCVYTYFFSKDILHK